MQEEEDRPAGTDSLRDGDDEVCKSSTKRLAVMIMGKKNVETEADHKAWEEALL